MGRPEMEPGRLCRTGGDDADLIAACKAGDTAAFGLIVARYQPAVVAVAYAAVRDRVLAEDIAQDAFVTAWTKLGGLRDAERLPAWLCGIARNVARARRRVRGREVPETEVATDATPYTQLDDAQREAALAAALERVPATYREPLVLVYCEQQSAHEVARTLGVSDAAVHQRLSRGRTMLAGDAQLVEHAGRRSRRDLAAAVLAAIAIGFGSSRVNASPRGKPMLKLAAVGIVAALAGTTYVVAHAQSSASAAPPAASATASPQRAARTAHTARAEGFARVATTLVAVTNAAHAAAAVPSLDCTTVGRHMAEAALAGQTNLPPAGMDDVASEIAPHFTASCVHQQWTQEYMACILGSTDMMSAGFDCAPYAPAGNPFDWADDPASAPPGEIRLPARTTPVPATTDTSCAGVARHLAEMSTPDPAAIAALPDGQRQAVEQGVQMATASMPAQIEKGCTDAGWTEQRRACLAAATTADEMGACI